MAIPKSDMFCLLSCSVRYALGRRSYVVAEVANLCSWYGTGLSDSERAVIAKDIREAIQEAEAKGETVGMAMDHETWKKCLAELEVMVSSRSTR